MSNIPQQLYYTRTHEWARLEQDGSLCVGITDHAQELLGDMVFVELPELGANLAKDLECAVVESVKAASDIYCPVAGEVIEINQRLEDQPELVNQEPYGAGWIFRLRPAAVEAVASLLRAAAYQQLIESEEG